MQLNKIILTMVNLSTATLGIGIFLITLECSIFLVSAAATTEDPVQALLHSKYCNVFIFFINAQKSSTVKGK